MVPGIAVLRVCHETWPDPQTAKAISGCASVIADIVLRLIKTIIAPPVLPTPVVGVAHMGGTKAAGRIGAKAMPEAKGEFVVEPQPRRAGRKSGGSEVSLPPVDQSQRLPSKGTAPCGAGTGTLPYGLAPIGSFR